ncbi:MAG: hypothetical protein JWP02_2687 [Acidimicrobiales bacterium]|nr:hypothetical protein [Acidimicrobiales bacterium]
MNEPVPPSVGSAAMPRRLAAAAVVVIGVAFLFVPPQQPHVYDNDQLVYARTVAGMRRGESYYKAAAASYRSVGGAVETTRAFRPPTAFLLWRWIPTRLLWPSFVVAVAMVSGLLLLRVTSVPLVVPVVTIYLLTLGRAGVEYLFVELWAVPLVAAALLAVERRRWWAAAGLALVATAVRELAGVLLIGALAAAIVHRRPWRPWVASIAAAGGLYALHVTLLQPYLVARGSEERLLGTGSLGAMLDMAGFQLPAHQVVGALLWALAIVGLVRTRRVALLGPYAMLPALGLLADRPYWRAMAEPFLMVWAGEGVVALRRLSTRSSTGAAS